MRSKRVSSPPGFARRDGEVEGREEQEEDEDTEEAWGRAGGRGMGSEGVCGDCFLGANLEKSR